jgi:hypothetical protein
MGVILPLVRISNAIYFNVANYLSVLDQEVVTKLTLPRDSVIEKASELQLMVTT